MNNTSPSITYERSDPLAIPAQNPNPQNLPFFEYNVTRNFFDPNKSSPPNSWNKRLLLRLGESRGKKIMQTNY